jgi:N-methylhydantoinase B/oxoprolinase/acetone carboxylase alpha subunit
VAVVLFNRATTDNITRNVSVPITRLHDLPGAAAATSGRCASVRDVARRRDLGVVCDQLSAMIEPRGAEMFRASFVR